MPRGRAPSPTSNRTDLLAPAPVQVAGGQTYGDRAQQVAAQRAIPMANGPTLSANVPPAGGPATPPPAGPPGPDQLQALADAHNGPGTSLAINRPTERPGEPVTHGLPVGPGAGPESLTGVGAAARDNVVGLGTLNNFLQNLSAQPNATSAVKTLTAIAASGQQ